MKNLSSKILIVAAFVLMAAACQNNGGRTPAPAEKPPEVAPAAAPAQTSPTESLSYQGQQGMTALALLKAKYPGKVDTTQSKYGEFVNAINGIKPDSKHFWSFYLNGKLSNGGAGSYETKNSDTIMWKLEEIKN